jgi:hypothetical protein
LNLIAAIPDIKIAPNAEVDKGNWLMICHSLTFATRDLVILVKAHRAMWEK